MRDASATVMVILEFFGPLLLVIFAWWKWGGKLGAWDRWWQENVIDRIFGKDITFWTVPMKPGKEAEAARQYPTSRTREQFLTWLSSPGSGFRKRSHRFATKFLDDWQLKYPNATPLIFLIDPKELGVFDDDKDSPERKPRDE
jgi:hypothetical protein